MRVVEFREDQLRFSDSADEPVAVDGEVIVSVTKAGICETDLQLIKGYMGFQGTLGHEFVGVAQSGVYEGQRVVGEINCPCQQCSTCRAGRLRHCPHRTVLGILNRNGAFADRLTLPEFCLHPVPDSVVDEHAVFAEPVAAACRIIEQDVVQKNNSVLILGAGRLGNLCAQVLRPRCRHLLVVGKHSTKLGRLSDIGIACEELSTFDPNAQWDVVVDCTGSPSGLDTAMQCVRACGIIVLKTTVAASQSMHFAPIVIDETKIVGSRCGPFQPALQLIAEEALQLAPLISATYDIESAVEAFDVSSGSDVLKVQLDIGAA